MKFSKENSFLSHNSLKEVEYYKLFTQNNLIWKSEKIIFDKYLEKDFKILDLGCGTGRTTFYLYNSGYKNVVGVDISENMIAEARNIAEFQKIPVEFSLGDATNLDISTKFDAVIFSFNGLTMIPDSKMRLIALQQIYNVLKENSYFIFTTLDREKCSDEYKIFWEDEKYKWINNLQDEKLIDFGDVIFKNQDGLDEFIHAYTKQEIIDMLNICKFKLIECPMRSELATETKEIVEMSDECRFWIVKK